jgi:hypothetical protein
MPGIARRLSYQVAPSQIVAPKITVRTEPHPTESKTEYEDEWVALYQSPGLFLGVNKEVVGIHVLLTRSLFGGGYSA